MSFLKEVTGSEIIFVRALILEWIEGADEGDSVSPSATCQNLVTAEVLMQKTQKLLEHIAKSKGRFQSCSECPHCDKAAELHNERMWRKVLPEE